MLRAMALLAATVSAAGPPTLVLSGEEDAPPQIQFKIGNRTCTLHMALTATGEPFLSNDCPIVTGVATPVVPAAAPGARRQ